MQDKAGLNSIYGCCCTQPLKDQLQIDKFMEFSFKSTYITEDEVEAGLEKYYTGKNNFLPYQIGCVVTSLARFELFQFIKLIGYEHVLYSDTDSLFYISPLSRRSFSFRIAVWVLASFISPESTISTALSRGILSTSKNSSSSGSQSPKDNPVAANI